MRALEEVDLVGLALQLQERFGPTLAEGYLDGRTILRDAVASVLGCSDYEAEQLVDTMEMNRYVHFPRLTDHTHSGRAGSWRIAEGLRPGL